MSWLSLAIALLKVGNSILTFYKEQSLMESGYRKAIADESLKTLALIGYGNKIEEQLNKTTDENIKSVLRDLEG